MAKRKNQSVVSYLTLIILTFILATQALKCYKCDGKDCTAAPPGEIEECGGEKPVCSQYIDLTGEQTGGNVGTVFKRYCGEGSLDAGEICKCLTPDWDECICTEELCNGHLPRCGIRNFGKSGEDGGCRK